MLCVTLNSNLGFIELDDRRGGARTGGRKGREGGKGGRMLFPSPDSRGGDVVNGHPSVKM